MPLAIPGFPDNVVALAYCPAASGEHWFEPSGYDAPGLLHPGPSHDVVLVVAAAEGHSLRYDIDSDSTLVTKDEPLPQTEREEAPPLRAHDLCSFAAISQKLINGTAKRAARATWHPSRFITVDAAHAPHFTAETGRPWAFRSDDLRARDWQAVG